MRFRSSVFSKAALAVLAFGLVAVPAGSAEATVSVSRNCSSTAQMCLHFNSTAYGLGAEFGSQTNITSFNYNINGGVHYNFKAGRYGSNGAGQTIWNKAAAGRNLSSYRNFAVFENSNYQGEVETVPYGYILNFTAVKNNDTSMKWI
ncbi:hypothetical protein [uncultured Tessaracoccus sp.]|uniref:hypothetical protein n=1 Tax=uncultured Tessaracoccus sp. TaxID=905023 RepID=UPI00262A4CFF|nr:hypothetical protein [uncultured Tessaracoccus sp.]